MRIKQRKVSKVMRSHRLAKRKPMAVVGIAARGNKRSVKTMSIARVVNPPEEADG